MFFCDEGTSRLVRRKAERLAKHPALHTLDREDIEQELWLQIVEKRHLFNPDRGTFDAFVARLCHNKAVSLIRYYSADKRNCDANGVSLNVPIDDEAHELSDALCEAAVRRHRGIAPRSDRETAELRLDVAGVLSRLDDPLADLGNLLKWKSKHSASKALNISWRQAHHHITRIRRRFEDAGLNQYL